MIESNIVSKRPTVVTIVLLITNSLIVLVASESKVSYKGYSLISARPDDQFQLKELENLVHKSETFNGIDFWLPPSIVGRDVSILVEPSAKASLRNYLKSHNISSLETVQDVGLEIELEDSLLSGQFTRQEHGSALDPFLTSYQSYGDIEQRILGYQNKSNVQVKLLGNSYEQRPIYVVQVSSSPQQNKPVILIDAGHHAREWITHSTIMYLMDSIQDNSGAKAQNKSYLANKLKDYDFWFVPSVNPDGYEYSHSRDRLWRKTRSRGSYCVGTDPNRNYNDHWNPQSKSYECSEVYAGKSFESEIEVKQMSTLLYYFRQRIAMYISLHSYSQLILWPFGYANVGPKNEDQVRQVAKAGVSGIKSYRGTSYGMGRTADILYVATGTSVDYAMSNCGIKFAYTVELPDRGQRGFVLGKQEIVPVGIETEFGLAAMVDKMTEFIH